MVSRRADLDAERYHNRRNLYAIDTNVLYFCAQPLAYVRTASDESDRSRMPSWRRQLRGTPSRMIDLGSVFRSDPPELHGVICMALAHYISVGFAETPLYIPEAIEGEIEGMHAHFAEFTEELTDFDAALVTRIRDRLATAIVEKFPLQPSAKDHLDIGSLRESLGRLVNVRAGPAAGLTRLHKIYEHGRLSNLSWINPVRLARRFYRSLKDLGEDQEKAVSGLSGHWDEALGEAGKIKGSQRSSDARALAEIELWNDAAAANGGAERLLYLTADKVIHTAAARRRVNGRTFAELYVRHPSAFLEDIIVTKRPPAVEVHDRTPPTSLLDWIDVLISSSLQSGTTATPGPAIVGSKPREAVRSFGSGNPDEARKLRDGWHALADLREGRLLDELGLSEWIDNLVSRMAAEGDGLPVEQLRNLLREGVLAEEASAWESCFNVAAELTLRLDKRNITMASRSSPPICFEAWDAAGQAVEQFKFWGYNERLEQSDFERLKDKLLATDPTRYAYYLAFASLFAGRGNWKAAAALSSFAHEFAQFNGRGEGGGANGREAAFLEAVARRHVATSPRQLDRSTEALGEARAILQWECENQGVDPARVVPERYDLEELDIMQTRLLFDIQPDPEALLDGERRPVALQLIAKYTVIEEYLGREFEHVGSWRTALPLELGSRDNVLLQTRLRAIVSACSLYCLGLDDDVRATSMIETLLVRWERLGKMAAAAGAQDSLRAIDASFLAKTVVGLARLLVARRNGCAAPTSAHELRRLLTGAQAKRHNLFPFDERRFAYMRMRATGA